MGFAVGNPMFTVIVRAIIVMMIAWFVGQVVGALAQRTIEKQIQEYKDAHPLPSIDPESEEDSNETQESSDTVADAAQQGST